MKKVGQERRRKSEESKRRAGHTGQGCTAERRKKKMVVGRNSLPEARKVMARHLKSWGGEDNGHMHLAARKEKGGNARPKKEPNAHGYLLGVNDKWTKSIAPNTILTQREAAPRILHEIVVEWY